ncbi:P2X purinoceptor 4a isoform X1 [Anguilla anguilla]|uniref:P2X purinoceptor 4a isoform X1 n=1 Tax=Anguilla anguilla TaxID=7936 RepID=UPI0015AF667F|nr:P2X purinoceptor 4a isoform X1 [Anguilla anguilla]
MTLDKGCCASICQSFFEYATPKILVIRSKRVGTVNRLIQAVIIAYVIGYVCVLKRGYQDTDSVISSVTTKVKGVALTNTSDLGLRVWDVADYIIPPQEESSFFVLTNMIITANQTQSRCPEVPGPNSNCSSDRDCTPGLKDVRGNGVQTGNCVNYSDSVKTCEVLAWCPLEVNVDPPVPPMLADAENFTVLIKNNIRYPKFNFNKRNILPHINKTYLTHCIFNATTDPDCPIFSLKYIVSAAQEDFQTMAVMGGVMGIQIRWDCDLDMPASWCKPRYTFRRLDNKEPENNVAPGYNFRFAKYYRTADDVEVRTLIKGFGIRFDVMVFGKAGKFSIVPMLLNIGAGLALLGLVTIVCDWVVLTFMKKRHQYREEKFSYVDDYGLLSETAE